MCEEEKLIVLEDENGEEVPCVELDRVELRGCMFAVLSPVDDEDSVMIYRVVLEQDGTESFDPDVSDEDNEDVFDYFRAAWDDYEFGDAE